jgi:mRNA interferase MazF
MSTTNPYNQGEVWYADVQSVSDPTQSKVRPVVIVGNEIALDIDVLVAPITTHHPRGQFDVILLHWQAAGLPRVSVARTNKLLTVTGVRFLRKLGTLHPEDLDSVLKKCRELF